MSIVGMPDWKAPVSWRDKHVVREEKLPGGYKHSLRSTTPHSWKDVYHVRE